ncbi:hypothetical protein ACPEIC_44635 [Stenotrophomonas sp. NPDC087984]
MNKKRTVGALAVTASVLATTFLAATPASAATLIGECSTTGASGGIAVYNFHGSTSHIKVYFRIKDNLADGHHVRIRLITKRADDSTVYWRWHSEYGGKGGDWEFQAPATDNRGIFDVGLQVARAEGSRILNFCSKWTHIE